MVPTSAIHRAKARAFSLIEVALALGIAAFAVVLLIALLPAGLNLFRTSLNTSVGAQIFQRIVNDAEQSDFDALLAQASAPAAGGDFSVLPLRYFDDQGTEVVSASKDNLAPGEASRVVFEARVRVSKPGESSVGAQSATAFTSLPASPGQQRFDPRDAVFLTVQIAFNPGGALLPVDSRQLWTASGAHIVTHSAVIARNGWSAQSKQ